MRDIHNSAIAAQSISARNVTAPVNGASVDLMGYEGAEVTLDAGTTTGTSPVAVTRLEESDDNSTFTAVAAADMLGGLLPAQIDGTTHNAIYRRGYIGAKRYIRGAVTSVTGTSPVIPMSLHITRGVGHLQPVSLL